MARSGLAGMGRSSSSGGLLARTILLISIGWILNSSVMVMMTGVEGEAVIDRDTNWNSLSGAGHGNHNHSHTDQGGTDNRDTIETEPGPTHNGSSRGDMNGPTKGNPPLLILPDFILTANHSGEAFNHGNNSHNELGKNQTSAEIEDDGNGPTVPEIEYQPGLVLRCGGKGYPRPNLTWELGDGHLPHYVQKIGLNYSLYGNDSTNHGHGQEEYWVDLRLPKLNNAFYGRLRCVAKNAYGNATWEVDLIHNANSSVFMKLVRITFATIFVLVAILLVRMAFWMDTRYKEKLYEKLPPQDLEIINKFKKGLTPPPPSPSSSICQSQQALGLGASCVGRIEITVTGDGSDAALMKEGYRPVREQSSTPDLQRRLAGGSSGGTTTPTSCCSVHVLDSVNSWANYVPYDDKLETSSQHFKVDLSTTLENGAYGMVFAGKVRNDLTMEWFNVAVKSGKSERDDNFLLESILTELKILASLPKAHDNIVNLRGAYTKMLHKRQAYVFLDYCENGTLANFIDLNRQYFQHSGSTQALNPSNNNSVSAINAVESDRGLVMTVENTPTQVNPDKREVAIALEDGTPKPHPFTLKELVAWSWQIADGMNFLHKNRINHGNLSTVNVYLTGGLTAKLGNIGCPPAEESSECIDETTKKWLTVPNFAYERFSKKSDVWDYGRVLWELFSLRGQQFPEKATILNFLRNDEEHQHEGDDDIEEDGGIEIPDYATPEIFDLMLCCWNEDGTLSPEFDFLSRALKYLSKEMFQVPVPTGSSNHSEAGTSSTK